MRFVLVGITNDSIYFCHIAYVKENGEKILEVRKTKDLKNAFQLRCPKSRSYKAILYIFKPPIKTIENGSSCFLVSETRDEMVTDVQNYDEVYHEHTKKYTNIDNNGVCRFVQHTDDCIFEKSQIQF